MDLERFCATSRVVIVAGKGGVGKTTVTAALAVAASRAGLSVLIVEVEGKSGLAECFGRPPLTYDEAELRPGVRARTLTPDEALVEYLENHGMRRIGRRLAGSGALEVVATAVPGMKDILVLGKVKQLEQARAADLVLIDAPAAGHAVSFLLSARGLLDAVQVGPVRKQASDVVELLSDPTRCQVVLVTAPEETPVSELVETAFAIEDRAGVALGPVVVNGRVPSIAGLTAEPVLPDDGSDTDVSTLVESARVRLGLEARQAEQQARLAELLPLPQITLPFLFTADIGPVEIDELADAFAAGVDALEPVELTGEVEPGAHQSIASVVDAHRVVVCCGTGGVGKTTTAAALAIHGARHGRRTVVVTIDPAKRLAQTLGLEHLSNVPHAIERSRWDRDGDAAIGGSLAALMLDAKSTFDTLVRQYAHDEAQAERILGNAFYRNIAGSLSGTQEYMASEKLYELHAAGDFDLIVVDTPPSRHALDFLDAPQRLTRLLDNRIFRLLMTPARAGFRVGSVAAQAFLRTVARVVGTAVIDDVLAFFRAFEGMEEGFRTRANEMTRLLGSDETAFVLVTSPRRDAVDEAAYFAARLADSDLEVKALVVNRVHPRYPGALPDVLRARTDALLVDDPGRRGSRALAAQYTNLADLEELAMREERALHGLEERMGTAAVAHVPELDHDVHDFTALGAVAAHLT